MESEPVLWFVSILMVLLTFLFVTWYSREERVVNFSIYFLSIVFEALPFMLLGTLVSGLIEVFVSHERIARMMPSRAWAVPIAALLGIVFPVCECAIVPVVRRLVRKGVPLSCAVAYMLAAPTINPLVTLSTAVAFQWNPLYFVGRFAAGFAVAVTVAWLVGLVVPEGRGLKDSGPASCSLHDHELGQCAIHAAPRGFGPRLSAVLGHSVADFFDVTRYLILGAFIAAFLRAFVDWNSLLSIHSNSFLSPLALMLFAFVMNLCSEADAFVAASFVDFSFHAKLAFLVLGPMLDIKLISLYSSVYKPKAIAALVVLVPVTVYVMSLAVDRLQALF